MITEKLTYKQAYDKIIQAYFRDEIKPMESNFCFCGTLNNGGHWRSGTEQYSYNEFNRMESALLIDDGHWSDKWVNKTVRGVDYPEYENDLFKAMSAALEVLKEIHRSRGEDVDEVPVFVKRELVTK